METPKLLVFTCVHLSYHLGIVDMQVCVAGETASTPGQSQRAFVFAREWHSVLLQGQAYPRFPVFPFLFIQLRCDNQRFSMQCRFSLFSRPICSIFLVAQLGEFLALRCQGSNSAEQHRDACWTEALGGVICSAGQIRLVSNFST